MTCPDCDGSALTHQMSGYGPADAEIMVVGQGPGAHEDMAGRPFVGKSGKLLRSMLKDAGIDPDSVYYTNATRCRTQGDRKPTPAEVSAGRPHLQREIYEVRPSVIIALGDTALQSLCKKSGVSNKRGQELALHAAFSYTPTPVYCTWHPAYILRVPQARAPAVADLRKVRDRFLPEDDVKWEWDDDGSRVLEGVVAWDIETNYDPKVKGSGRELEQVAYTNGEQTYVNIEAPSFLDLDKAEMRVTHNGWAFDIPIMFENGWDESLESDDIWGRDTLVMAYLDDETQPLGLEPLCVKYLGVRGWKEDKSAPLGSDEFAAYNARDAVFTLRLYHHLLERLGPRINIADKIILPAYLALRRASERGIWIDPQAVARVKEICEQEKTSALISLGECGVDNPNSTRQIAKAIMDDGGYHLPVTPSGEYATGKALLQSLTNCPVAEHALAYRKANKALSTYIKPYEAATQTAEGRVHPEFLLWRTATGRSASRNPNVQNVPREYKAMYSAPPGKVRLVADWNSIEFRLAAWVANETGILKRFQENPNWDPHRYFASIFFGKAEDDVAALERQIAKSGNFELLFMGSPPGLVQYAAKLGLTLSLSEAQEISRVWHQTFPAFKPLYREAAKRIRKDGYIETATGRRRHFGDVSLMHPTQFAAAVREGVNMLVQSLAADIMFVAVAELDRLGLPITDEVHDSIAVEINDDPETLAYTRLVMQTTMTEYAPEFLRREFGCDLRSIPLTVEFEEYRCSRRQYADCSSYAKND